MSDTPTRLHFRPAAMVLAWILPGLGHCIIGERARGVRIGVGVLFLFFGGLLIGGVDVVDRREDRLWFVAQAGCGPLAIIADWVNGSFIKTGRIGTLLPRPGTPSSPARQGEAATVSDRKSLAHANEFGTLFIALAGMMNAVVILDAGFRRRAEATS